MTLEDETGSVNVIVHVSLQERQRQVLLGAFFLGVYGVWQRAHGVGHLIAQRLVDLSPLIGELTVRSRNFH